MPKFVCPYGHTEPDPAHPGQLRALTHASRSRCAIYRQLRNEKRVDIWGRYLPGKGPDAPTGAPSEPGTGPGATPPSSPAQAEPTAEPRPEGKEPLGTKLKRLGSGIGVRYRTTTTTPPAQEGEAAQATNWEISEETCVRFWTTIFGFIEQLIHLITNFLEIPPVPAEVFTIDPGQQFVFRTALRGFTTNILVRVFRAKSPEDADRIVAGLSGLLGFGMMAIKIAIHLMIHVPKSPKLAKWREARARRLAERQRREAALKEEREVGQIGGQVVPNRFGVPGPTG